MKKFSKTKTKKGEQLVSYYLFVHGHQVIFDESSKVHPSVKYTLSEGDKSAIAFSFYLAKLKISPDLGDKIVVFDDPISSFDYARKNSTINQLINLSHQVSQLLVLTHDIDFAEKLTTRIGSENILNLKIVRKAGGSIFVRHDIETETLSGVFKDISVLNN